MSHNDPSRTRDRRTTYCTTLTVRQHNTDISLVSFPGCPISQFTFLPSSVSQQFFAFSLRLKFTCYPNPFLYRLLTPRKKRRVFASESN